MSLITVTVLGAGITVAVATAGVQGPPGIATWGQVIGTLTDQTDLMTRFGTKADLASPHLTGVPTAPTAADLTGGTQIATVDYANARVTAAINALLAGAPGALDTLNELATAIGSDPNFASTMASALAARVRTDTAAQGLDATHQLNARTNVGLSHVDDTSDASKPVSTAQALADTATLNSAKAYTDSQTAALFGSQAAFIAVGADLTNINAVAGDLANIDIVAGDRTNVDVVAGVAGNMTTVAGIAGAVSTVAGISANVTTVAGDVANINTVAGDHAQILTVAGDHAQILTVAGDHAQILVVANAVANVNVVAGAVANVNAVGGSIASVNTAAANIVAIQNAPAAAAAAAASAAAAAASAATLSASTIQGTIQNIGLFSMNYATAVAANTQNFNSGYVPLISIPGV